MHAWLHRWSPLSYEFHFEHAFDSLVLGPLYLIINNTQCACTCMCTQKYIPEAAKVSFPLSNCPPSWLVLSLGFLSFLIAITWIICIINYTGINKNYHIAWKILWGIKFGGWPSARATAKISYLHNICMAIPYQTAKFKSTNMFAMAIWEPTTKFNSH